MTEFDITSPVDREKLLAAILPETASQHHELLKRVFEAEIACRRSGKDHAFFENLYWCAFLLFIVGDPGDTEAMWRAKHINMDTGCNFDAENMVGAGADETVAYLDRQGLHDIARYILSCTDLWEHARLESWKIERRRYFYGI
jgi:hypothetical protein